MTVQKIETVKTSRKDQGKCSKCGTELPVGTGYLCWYPGFRSKTKIVRCLKSECYPRPSERETSKAVTILAAQEAFEDDLQSFDEPGEVEAAVQEVADAVREVADEYQEALDQWGNGNESMSEKVDHYTSQCDEIDGWSWDGNTDYDLCDKHEDREDNVPEEEIQECLDCHVNRENWIEECRQAAADVVQSVETA